MNGIIDMKLCFRMAMVVLISWMLSIAVMGQEPEEPVSTDSAATGLDSVTNLGSLPALSDGGMLSTPSKGRSPTGALLRSLVFPGWGQFYNRKYIKGLAVMAGEGFCIIQAARYWDLAQQAVDLYTETRNLDYYYTYDFYQDRRNLYLWLSGISIFLSMIDAYVDAHLANFDIDVTPPFEEPESGIVKLSVSYRF